MNLKIARTQERTPEMMGMQMRRAAVLAFLALAGTGTAIAAAPFTAVFSGTGRACSGGLYVRTQTIEWNSSFSICKPSRYSVLEKDLAVDHGRIAFRLAARSRQCRYEVIEAKQVSTYGWSVQGYPSLEAYRKRALPGWRHSPRDERMVLSCPMVRLD
ncbi:hypothetical protein [Variovorax paradoxus]|uniref:hypothetical protein n=1 Tax=Variovorax paradoxus TaxID=34073 RepID=UPI0029C8E3A9|nr:hypothetical protein [Variovorax paradoxus]WPH19414.1 hypothetical protein RZE78_20575 [Variovorax paradoxus]